MYLYELVKSENWIEWGKTRKLEVKLGNLCEIWPTLKKIGHSQSTIPYALWIIQSDLTLFRMDLFEAAHGREEG